MSRTPRGIASLRARVSVRSRGDSGALSCERWSAEDGSLARHAGRSATAHRRDSAAAQVRPQGQQAAAPRGEPDAPIARPAPSRGSG
jgi:hypothetical protein